MSKVSNFIFLDDVQFSNGSYTSSVRILSSRAERWLTVPVSAKMEQHINQVKFAKGAWRRSDLDVMQNEYGAAPRLSSVAPDLEKFVLTVQNEVLAAFNSAAIELIASPPLGLDASAYFRLNFLAPVDI